jgi:hypothetical protein
MDGLLSMFEEQFKKGEPYRDAFRGLLRGDTSGWNKLNAPTLADPQEAVDIATGFAGTIKPVQRKVFEEAFNLAQQRAALPISEGGLGLPATNTAMDRANAMGYTNPAYHGTKSDITQFDKSMDRTNAGFWFGEAPIASKFAEASRDGVSSGENVIPVLLKQDNPYYHSNTDRGMTISQISKKAKNNNNDSINFYGEKSGAVNLIHEPNQIRSINAAFDPFRRNEPDILAGVAAAPAGLLAIDKEKPKKKRSNK